MNFLKILFAVLIPGVFSNIRDEFKARDQWGGNKGGTSETKRDDIDDDKIDGSGKEGGDDDGEGDDKTKKDPPPAAKSAEELIKEAEERENQNDEPYTSEELVEIFQGDGKLETGKVFDVDGQKMSMAELIEYSKKLGDDEQKDVSLRYKGRVIEMETLEALAAEMEIEDDPGDDETITLVKKTIKATEFPDLVEKAGKYYNIDLSKYKEDDQKKLLEAYLNLKEGSKIVNDRHQDNAKTKRELEAMQAQINQDKIEVTNMQENIKKQKEELEEKVKAAKEIMKLDPEDEIDTVKQNRIISKQTLAEKDLEDAKKEEARIKETEDKVQAYQIAIFVQENTMELQTEFPELRTTKNAEDIIDYFDRNGDYDDDSDLTRALRIREVLNKYADLPVEARRKTPISKFYSKLRLSMTELKSAPSENKSDKPKKDTNSNPGGKKTRKLSVAELISRTIEKQKNTPRNPRGGSDKRSTENKTSKRDPNYANKTGWKRDDGNRVVDSDYDLNGALKDHKDYLARKKK